MSERREYEMSEQQLQKIMEALRPMVYLVVGGGMTLSSPQDNANRAWAALGRVLGFKPMSVRPVAGKVIRFFTAEPTESEYHIEAISKAAAEVAPEFDVDGYPTESTLEAISEWPVKRFADCQGLLEFVAEAWQWPDLITDQGVVDGWQRWEAITGGWSGNEDLIVALQQNRVAWKFSWEESNRGGRHVFSWRSLEAAEGEGPAASSGTTAVTQEDTP